VIDNDDIIFYYFKNVYLIEGCLLLSFERFPGFP